MAEADLLGIQPPVSRPPATHGLHGHRARLRARLQAAGGDALADHELLEAVLFLAIPRRDTKQIARDLLARFGSFPAVIAAPAHELKQVPNISDAGAAAIRIVQVAAQRLLAHEARTGPLLANWDQLMSYLTAALARERTEQFRCLFLDPRNRLLADEVMGRGSISHAPVYPREVARRCLEVHATSVILVHNHPSGDATPSAQDIEMTREVKAALAPLQIAVHDHLIIGLSGYTSLRRLGAL